MRERSRDGSGRFHQLSMVMGRRWKESRIPTRPPAMAKESPVESGGSYVRKTMLPPDHRCTETQFILN